MNLMMLLEMASATFPDRNAFTDGSTGQTLTYQGLFDAAANAARSVRDADVQRFGQLDISSLGTPISLFSSAWAGVPYVPMNYRLTNNEIGALLDRITPAFVVTDQDRVPALSAKAKVEATADFVRTHTQGNVDAHDADWSMDPEEVAVLLFTSGTTGEPKAAVLRHKHLVSYILSSVEFGAAEEGETSLVCVPPYHIAGIAAMLSSVYSGRHVVQLPNFSAESWIDLARQHQVTTAFVVPTMLARIVEAMDGQQQADMPHLRNLSYGGGKMPLQVIERAMALFPETNFSNAYGLTETSSTICLLGPDEHREAIASADEAVRKRLVSVGKALPGVEIEIRDEDDHTLGAGERGEIYVRGEQVSGEYEGRGSVTNDEGWFATRDAGSMDADGYLFLEGRADDVIVRGGENLSPGEIEDHLLTHPDIADAAVVGVPDTQWGEAVAAALVMRGDRALDQAAVAEFVKSALRSSRVPAYMEQWQELPYTETGKLLRRIVREKLSANLAAAP